MYKGQERMASQTIGVIGAGLMGHGIAYLLAAAGHTVRIYDPSAEWRNSLSQRLKSALDLLDGDPALLGRISAHDQLAPAMKDVSFVFEAAPEKLPLKQQLFAELEALTSPTTILASNSSAIPSTRIGEKLKHRDRVVGTHFWNPPHLVPLVEVTQNEIEDAAFKKMAEQTAGEQAQTLVRTGFSTSTREASRDTSVRPSPVSTRPLLCQRALLKEKRNKRKKQEKEQAVFSLVFAPERASKKQGPTRMQRGQGRRGATPRLRP